MAIAGTTEALQLKQLLLRIWPITGTVSKHFTQTGGSDQSMKNCGRIVGSNYLMRHLLYKFV